MRRNGKAALAVVLIWILTLGLCGCGKDKALYEKGTSIVSLMREMAGSESYMQLTANENISERLDAVRAADYFEPAAVYKLNVREGAMNTLLGAELTGVSDELSECLNYKAYYALVSQINAADGAETIAAASICSVTRSIADKSAKGSAIYLYDYADAPAAAVVFCAGEEGTVEASGVFILNAEFKANSAESIEEAFHGMVEAEKVA